MPSGIYTATADTTHRQASIGAGMDSRLLFICGCKAHREPGCVMRGRVPLSCAACARSPLAAVCGDEAAAVGSINNGVSA